MVASPIWITRTEPSASLLAYELRKHGYACIVEPVLEIYPVPVEMSNSQFDLVIYLSSHAVNLVPSVKQGCCATLAVGNRTAGILEDNEITAEVPSEHSSEGLADLIQTNYSRATTVLIVCGTQGRTYLKETLRENGLKVETCEVYRRQRRDFSVYDIYSRSDVILIESLECLQIIEDALDSVEIKLNVRKHVIVPSSRIAKVTTRIPNLTVHVSNGVALASMLQVLSRINTYVES